MNIIVESAAENRSRTVRTKVFASILDDADGEKNIEEIDLPSEDYVLLNTIKEGVTEIRGNGYFNFRR